MEKDFSNLGFQHLNMGEKERVYKLFQAARSKKRQCLYPGCKNLTEGWSHILQKKGVLDTIAEESHVMQLSFPTPYSPLRFERKGINSADMLVFRGFCNKHDSCIFDEIENHPCDFTLYSQQLLSAYRGQLNELAKQYFLVDFHTSILEDSVISKLVKQHYEEIRRMMACRIRHGEYFKQVIERNLFNGATSDFIFHRFELPKIPIATSAVSGLYIMIPNLNYEDIRAVRFELFSMSSFASIIFINLIPTGSSLIFSFGHSNNVYQFLGVDINDLSSFSVQRIFKFISDLLVRLIETWCMAPSLYKALNLQGKIEELLAIKSLMNESSKFLDIEFNMFDGLI